MKRVFHNLTKVSGAAELRPVKDSAPVVRRLIFGFLTIGTLLLPTPANATSVVALIDNVNHRVVIAADCRVNRRLASLSECKIIEEPGCTVAIAGLYRENATAFNLRRLVDAACRYPGNLREKAEAFLRLSRKPYEAAVRHIRETDPSEFRRTIENRPTEVIFAGLLKGHVTLLVRGFVSDPRGRITTERYESSDRPNSSIGYFVGLNGRIREGAKPFGQWERLGYAEAARRFVEMEISANPDLAGPPISELEIDERGTVHWIARGACDTRESD
jgi:hypothetical protein